MSNDGSRVILPETITLQASGGRYLSLYDGTGLRANKTEDELDASCNFEVINSQWGVRLQGSNGKFIQLIPATLSISSGEAFFRCGQTERSGSLMDFDLIPGNGTDKFYLRSQDPTAPSLARYISSNAHSSADGVVGYASRTSNCLFTISEPIDSRFITDVQYDLQNPILGGTEEVILAQHEIINNTPFADSQLDGHTSYTFTKSKVGTWNNELGAELSTTTTFKAGIPLITEGGTQVTVKGSYNGSWGGSTTEEESVTLTAQGRVPAKHRAILKFVVKRRKMTVRFTYKEVVTYKNKEPSRVERKKRGVYNNVETFSAQTILTDVQSL